MKILFNKSLSCVKLNLYLVYASIVVFSSIVTLHNVKAEQAMQAQIFNDFQNSLKIIKITVMKDHLKIFKASVNKNNCKVYADAMAAVSNVLADSVQQLGQLLGQSRPFNRANPRAGFPLEGRYGDALALYTSINCNVIRLDLNTSIGGYHFTWQPN